MSTLLQLRLNLVEGAAQPTSRPGRRGRPCLRVQRGRWQLLSGAKQPRLRDYSTTPMSRALDAMGLGSSRQSDPDRRDHGRDQQLQKVRRSVDCCVYDEERERADQHIYRVGEVSPPIQDPCVATGFHRDARH